MLRPAPSFGFTPPEAIFNVDLAFSDFLIWLSGQYVVCELTLLS